MTSPRVVEVTPFTIDLKPSTCRSYLLRKLGVDVPPGMNCRTDGVSPQTLRHEQGRHILQHGDRPWVLVPFGWGNVADWNTTRRDVNYVTSVVTHGIRMLGMPPVDALESYEMHKCVRPVAGITVHDDWKVVWVEKSGNPGCRHQTMVLCDKHGIITVRLDDGQKQPVVWEVSTFVGRDDRIRVFWGFYDFSYVDADELAFLTTGPDTVLWLGHLHEQRRMGRYHWNGREGNSHTFRSIVQSTGWDVRDLVQETKVPDGFVDGTLSHGQWLSSDHRRRLDEKLDSFDR